MPNLIQQESLVRKHFVNGITDMTLKHKMLVDPPASVETAVQYAERYVAARDCMSKQKPVRMVRPADDELDSDDESSDSAEFQLDGIKFVRKGAPSQRKTKRESTPLRNRGTSGKTDKAFDIERSNAITVVAWDILKVVVQALL